MKNIGFVVLLFFTVYTYGQKSIYFSIPLPSENSKVENVDAKHFGVFLSPNGDLEYQVDENGITISSTTISSISRETLRESSKYDMRNGYLFGVVKNDSIPCVEEGERVYFGIRNEDVLVGEDVENVLTRLSKNEYILNLYEGGNYLPAKLVFKNKEATIAYFDYEPNTEEFDFIVQQKSIEMEYFDLVLLTPDPAEMKGLLKTSAFDDQTTLTKSE